MQMRKKVTWLLLLTDRIWGFFRRKLSIRLSFVTSALSWAGQQQSADGICKLGAFHDERKRPQSFRLSGTTVCDMTAEQVDQQVTVREFH